MERLKILIGLIKEKNFDKRMDEFKQNECVICFEDFTKGVEVRKLPTCRHLFHKVCIDGWFKAKMEETVHKCPLCNGEISIEKVKEALKKRKEERKSNNKGGESGKSKSISVRPNMLPGADEIISSNINISLASNINRS